LFAQLNNSPFTDALPLFAENSATFLFFKGMLLNNKRLSVTQKIEFFLKLYILDRRARK